MGGLPYYLLKVAKGSLVNNGGLGSNWLRKGIPNVTCNIVLGTKSAILSDEARLRLE